jgi:hypothetical protein
MDRKAGQLANEIGNRVEDIAAGMASNASATKAGLAIETGIKGFRDRFQSKQADLYAKLDRHIPPMAPVPVTATSAKLAELSTPIQGAENVSARLQSPAITAINEALAADAQGGMIPYRAIKELRTQIGEKISNPSLVSDISTAQWRQLYGALSQDMESAATAAGPEALHAFNRANKFTAAGHARIEDVLNRVVGKDTAEKVFQAAVNPSEMRQGGTTVAGVLRSIEPAERKIVTSAVVRRMGLATPGQQNELGEQFSSQTFLTNWNKIAPEAKAVLFPDSGLRTNLEQVAKAANMIRLGSKVFANPSGTAPALGNQVTYMTIGGALVTGRLGIAATIASLLTGSNLTARLVTNPTFVRWLAGATKAPPATIPALVNNIVRQSQNWSPEDRVALRQAFSEAGLSGGEQDQAIQAP